MSCCGRSPWQLTVVTGTTGGVGMTTGGGGGVAVGDVEDVPGPGGVDGEPVGVDGWPFGDVPAGSGTEGAAPGGTPGGVGVRLLSTGGFVP